MLTFNEFFKSGDIVNLSEQAVYDEIKAFIDLQEVEFCQCDKCLFDIACVVLNAIPSLYSSSVVDRNYPSADFSVEYEHLRKLAKEEIPGAIARVKTRLHH
ncbi:late competence development ComFB family protein [Maridesulfovibrio ferrireducens]|uniref:Competence protein ComFB n=1 Tax=Maridesulfovibrio ferrireducens TaxID=246191 RepID=A0A1G9KN55_9BACT|nr:late competence development ComFB family protein [Maridesulfovibrio ferrireducens]MBI9110694.1 late competence development ComFB family protein [Maridesulfovibrio ferrireducens]SDL51036.1 competence protein ComFB [Maridesulfovibrio ferrireducens]